MSRQNPIPPPPGAYNRPNLSNSGGNNGNGNGNGSTPPFPPFPTSAPTTVEGLSSRRPSIPAPAQTLSQSHGQPTAYSPMSNYRSSLPLPPPNAGAGLTPASGGPASGSGQGFYPLPPVFGSPRRPDRDRDRDRYTGGPPDTRRPSASAGAGAGAGGNLTAAGSGNYIALPPSSAGPVNGNVNGNGERRPSQPLPPAQALTGLHNPYPQPSPSASHPHSHPHSHAHSHPPPHPNPYVGADRERERERRVPAPAISSHAVLVQSPEEDDDGDDDEGDMDDGESALGPGEDLKAGGGGGIAGAAGSTAGTPAAVKKRRPHATRRRAVQSCSECRRRKIKCDKKFPCGPCILRSDETRCHEVGMAEKNVNASPSTLATASDLAQVAQRLDALESALLKKGTLVPAEIDKFIKMYRAGSAAPQDLPSMSLLDTPGADRDRRMGIKVEEAAYLDRHTGREGADDDHVTGRPHTDVPIRHTDSLARDSQRPLDREVRLVELGRGGDTDKRQTFQGPMLNPSTAVPAPERSQGGRRQSVSDGGGDGEGDGDGDGQDDTEGAALTLEHLAFGRSRVEGAHAIPHFGARIPSSIQKHAPNNDYHLARSSVGGNNNNTGQAGAGTSPMSGSGRALSISASAGNSPAADLRRKSSLNLVSNAGPSSGGGGAEGRSAIHGHGHSLEGYDRRTSYGDTLSSEERQMRIDALLDLIGPTDVFDLFYRKTDVAARALTKVLPSRERGELLVKTYLEKVDWLHRCLHVPTFLRQCHDLWAIPHDLIVHEIAMPFIALYFSVCCLGMQFMDAREANKYFLPDEIRELPDLWFNAARSSMWAADFVGTHASEHLQSLLLLSVFMNNRDRGEAAWALLGAGIKMAQGLGLSRLGAELTSADTDNKARPMWTGRWESLIQREVGRRIWWNYVFLDWALAPQYNFSCSIHPDQIKTALPANVEDEDIIDGQPLRPRPPHVRTGMSFTLGRLRFSEIAYRQIREANTHRHPPYSFILAIDAEHRQAMMELPLFFQPNSSDRPGTAGGARAPPSQGPKVLVQYYEKIMLNLAIHSRMLRLHRPWLSKGYTDERFAYSKEQCIRAARASLRMMSDTHGTAAFLEKWWLPLFYVSVSGLVVIIDLLRTNRRDMHSTETEQKINEVKGALDQMRQIADVSHPSRAAVKVMEFLLAEVEERRRPPGSSAGKRKAPDDDEADGLQRAVKKLIRQAQLEVESPSTSIAALTNPPSTGPPAGVSPRDRPVFDAYPHPQAAPCSAPASGTAPIPDVALNPVGPSASISGAPGGATGQARGSSGLDADKPLGPAPSTYPYNTMSPFSFPLDLNTGNAFPTFLPSASTPQLDPSVEDLLANYFPPNGQNINQNQTWGTVPDDFLSRVFSFSWDTNNPTTMPLTQGQGPGQRQGQAQIIPAHGPPHRSSSLDQNGPALLHAGGNMGAPPRPHGPGGTGKGINPAMVRQQQQQQPQRQHGSFGGIDPLAVQGSEAFVPFDWGTGSGGWMA